MTCGETEALKWVKSSCSDSSNGSERVEVAAAPPRTVQVRDSKSAHGPPAHLRTASVDGLRGVHVAELIPRGPVRPVRTFSRSRSA
ncbi:DUF397 domain-containing protein [Streptomyces sp. NPDC050529]|uniref:DUF397 domain-containing protein n=1 Tax=Streptomyces sp. NPDC050529 TaxID=3365624 RepID=UPI0037912044